MQNFLPSVDDLEDIWAFLTIGVDAVLCLIERQRNSDVIDQGLVNKVVFSFVFLALDNSDPRKECLDVYKELLETPFIDATDHYYKKEFEAFLAENTVSIPQESRG